MNLAVQHSALIPMPQLRRPVLVSRELRRRIFRDVVTAHLIFVLLPAGWFFLKQWWLAKRPPVITVQLVSAPLEARSPDPTPVKTVEPPAATPTPPTPVKTVEPPKPTPPPPTPPKPTPTPLPKPKPTPVKTVPTPPQPKAWQPLSAESITVNREVIKNQKPTPDVSAAAIESRLRGQQIRVSPAGPSGPVGPVSQVPAGYFDTVASLLYQRWTQPSRAELGGKRPTVSVTLVIEANGKIRSATIIRRSGMAAMDSSVQALLSGLTVLPSPPNGAMTISVSMEIVDN